METSDAGWWCSGFYPGVLIKLYQQTGNEQLLTEAKRILNDLESQQYNKNTHDLGFMMYCSFGNLQEIKPSKEHENVLINSAKSLASRFDPTVGCIRSWNSDKTDYIVIIDNMMNLELLFWATKATGDSSFYKIAVKHANTTMANHFRANYSSYHVINYNAETGKPQKKITAQGYSDNSAWARGQAWGLYGYTVMYRETHNRKYLLQAKNIASFILSNPRLPADKIPYWDYDAPDIPDAKRDASAAAIMASAFLELCRYSSGTPAGLTYFNTAQTILKNLSKPAYTAPAGSNGGFILKHSVGNMNNKTEVDAPLTYADYYYVEALERYKKFK